MKITISKLRENIYQILDEVLKTGKPIEIERHGKILQVAPVEKPNKLDRLIKRKTMKGDPESLVHIDWSNEWKPNLK